MASELSLVHDHLVSSSKANQASIFINDASSFQISRGVDVPSTNQQLPYSTTSSSYALKSEYSFGGFTPPSYWSDTSLSPVVGSSTCSTETESNNEEDDDFMAGLAEQMTHFMLDNDEEDELHTPPAKAFNSCCSNSYNNSHWPTGGSRSHSSSTETLAHPPASLSNPAAWNDDILELLHSVEAGKAAVEAGKAAVAIAKMQDMNFLGEHVSSQTQKQLNNEASLGRKIEELLQKQALQKIPLCTPHLSKDSSLGRVESAIGLHASGGPNPKSSNGVKNRHIWKLREDERKQNTSQCRDRRHGASYSWVQRSKPQQQCSAASGHGRMNMQNIWAADQRGARMLDPTAFSWNATSNLRRGSNMRAVFLSSGGLGRESAGTGVFLPRCTGNNLDTKRKPACSTVLLPSRIVQVLNLHIDQIGDFHPQQYYPAHLSASTPYSSMANYGAATGNLKYYSHSHQDYRHSYPTSSFPQSSQELNLPLEWTY